MKALMDEHLQILQLVREISDALEVEATERAAEKTTQLAELFGRHAMAEEAGLFLQLELAGEALGEVHQLQEDHQHLRSGFGDPEVSLRPQFLRQLLSDLAHHAEVEETDLFPFALQVLPGASWHLIGQATG